MSKQNIITAGTLAALCLMAIFSMHARAAGQEGQDGMVVVRDPQTGKMRAPTPDELKVLRNNTPAAAALSSVPRAASLGTRHDGARGVRLGDRTMVYDVVTRGADGKLSRQCVEGADAAQNAIAHPHADAHADTPAATSRENVHESR
jgi:hypothetical protein